MANHDQIDKELVFENTPLQNLRNILFNADASMIMQANISRPGNFSITPDPEQKGVSKTDIRKAINKVCSVPEKYVSAAFVGRITCELCSPDAKKANTEEYFFNNIYINRISEIIRFSAVLQQSAP